MSIIGRHTTREFVRHHCFDVVVGAAIGLALVLSIPWYLRLVVLIAGSP